MQQSTAIISLRCNYVLTNLPKIHGLLAASQTSQENTNYNPLFNIYLSDTNVLESLLVEEAEELITTPLIPAPVIKGDACAYTADLQHILQLVMVNEKISIDPDPSIAFLPVKTKFCPDNCATYHICNDKSLFIERSRKSLTLESKELGGLESQLGLKTLDLSSKMPPETLKK